MSPVVVRFVDGIRVRTRVFELTHDKRLAAAPAVALSIRFRRTELKPVPASLTVLIAPIGVQLAVAASWITPRLDLPSGHKLFVPPNLAGMTIHVVAFVMAATSRRLYLKVYFIGVGACCLGAPLFLREEPELRLLTCRTMFEGLRCAAFAGLMGADFRWMWNLRNRIAPTEGIDSGLVWAKEMPVLREAIAI